LLRFDVDNPPFQFNQAVRVRSVVLQSHSEVQAPKSIKLFVNRPSLGFEDVEDASELEAAQVLTLSAEDVKQGNRIVLRYVRFQAVNSLHVRPISFSLVRLLSTDGWNRYSFKAIKAATRSRESMC
jgi:hypothetical protein